MSCNAHQLRRGVDETDRARIGVRVRVRVRRTSGATESTRPMPFSQLSSSRKCGQAVVSRLGRRMGQPLADVARAGSSNRHRHVVADADIPKQAKHALFSVGFCTLVLPQWCAHHASCIWCGSIMGTNGWFR